MREVWSGVNTVTGVRPSNSKGAEGYKDWANELNLFFNRFDTAVTAHSTTDLSVDSLQPPAMLLSLPPPSYCTTASCDGPDTPPHMSPSLTTRFRDNREDHSGKSAGLDGVSPWVLKVCALQLFGVFHNLFMMSLSLQRFPVLWKTSCLVPVPKTPYPSGPHLQLMNNPERLILDQLRQIG